MNFEVSNDLNFLADVLKKDIFNGKLFDTRLLILPSEQLKAWLINEWTEGDGEIVAGVQFLTLDASIFHLLNCIKDRELHFPSSIELKLLIYDLLGDISQKISDPILNSYLSEDRDRRLIYLTEILANLFQNYSKYGFELIAGLENSKDWQKKLFHKIFYEKNYSFLLKEYPFKTTKKLNLKIYLFGFTYLPEIYFDFFHSLSKVAELFIYYPRLTSGFWEDIQSEKQEKFIQKKYFNNCFDLQDWTLEMYEMNTFLANFGGLGKRYEKTLGNYDLDHNERYFERDQKTLLNTFQNHILNLSSLDEITDIEENTATISIQEINGSKLEELKLVYEDIQAQLAKDDTKLNDIVVLAPNINKYVAHIKTLFDRKGGAIDFKIYDVELSTVSHLAKGIEKILSLSNSDWTMDDIFTILDNPLVQAKFKIGKSEVEYFKKLLEKTRLRFSYNETHKAELIGYKNISGTWEESFQKIIMAYSTFGEEFKCDDYPQLFMNITQSDLQKIEAIFQVISSLYSETVSFKQNSLQELSSYALNLSELIDKYFFISDDPNELVALDFFKSFCLGFNKKDLKITISFQHFRSLLLKALKAKTTTFQAHLCEAVQFGSLGSDKWPSFKHVYMIGMGSSSFPSKTQKSSLDLLEMGKYPTKNQFDRFVFLTTIINSKESLWISHPSQLGLDESSINLPSIFVQELSLFLNKHYKVNALSFKEWNLKSNLKKTKESNKKLLANNLLSINYPSSLVFSKNLEITTYDLMKLAKNPIGFYLEKKHHVVFPDLFDSVEEDFFLTPLNKTIFLHEQLTLTDKMSPNKLNELLPVGIFQNIAINQLEQETQNLKEKAEFFHINLDELIDIEITKDVSKVVIDHKKMYIPAISLDLGNKQITITGKIKNAHPKGLIFFKDNTTYEWIKNWPAILLFALIAKQNAFCSDIYFLKSKTVKNISKINEDKFLKAFVRYYLVASEHIFPFTRSFVANVIKKDLTAVNQTFQQLFTKNLKYQDPLEKWFVKHFKLNMDDAIFSPWANYINYVFYPIIHEL